MQKYNIPCIKTGDFAKLCNTNKRTLFHYDEIGLFTPAYTDEKGYRYYSETQCDVFFTISCLRELGMPLKEIKAYIDNRSPEALKELLNEQKQKVLTELERLQQIRQVIDTKLELVKTSEALNGSLDSQSVSLQQLPTEYLILSKPLHTNDHAQIIQTLYDHIGYCSQYHLNSGHPYGAMLDIGELRLEHWDTYAHFFTKVPHYQNSHPCFVKPAGTYAVTYLRGDYYDADAAYRNLFQWIDENHLQTGQYSYKEAVIDELAADEPSQYLTKISVYIRETYL